MTTLTLQLEKMTCPSCMQKITDSVNELTGIKKQKFYLVKVKQEWYLKIIKYQKKRFFIEFKRLDIQQRK